MADIVGEASSMSNDSSTQGNESLDEPPTKKKKMMTNSEHIYERLYLKGKYSDVTIRALGKDWKLHKEIIAVSPYFASMFSGAWKESGQEVISIDVPDENVTVEAISLVFGSLYCGPLDWETESIVAILATASLFQLQELIDKCEDVMKSNMDLANVVPYYNAAVSYGLNSVKMIATQLLEANILSDEILYDYSFLKQISTKLMADLVSSPELIPGDSEFTLYCLLTNWLFSLLQKDDETTLADPEEFFTAQKWGNPFLNTEEGKKYTLPFNSLRIEYIITGPLENIDSVEKDNVISQEWINAAYRHVCKLTLEIHQSRILGVASVSESKFEEKCCKFSQHWQNESDPWHSFTKVSFLFGLNLVFYLRKNSFVIKRFAPIEGLAAACDEYNFAIKVDLKWPDEKKFIKKTLSSGLKFLSLKLEKKETLLSFTEDLAYPVCAVIKLLVHSSD